MSRRRGGLWRRTLWGGSGGGLDPAEALLNEAAVRFDFSQYTDINDMVDVNGGWGPLTVNFAAHTTEFTALGLHVTSVAAPDATFNERVIDGVAGPLVLGPDGLTYVEVVEYPVGEPPTSVVLPALWSFQADSLGEGSPSFEGNWRVTNGSPPGDDYQASAYDSPPNYDIIFSPAPATAPATAPAAGILVTIAVLDVAASVLRLTLVGPDARFDVDIPFDKPVPDFAADPRVIDALSLGGAGNPAEFTQVESDVWNRALTPAEVDTLIAHFTPVPDPAQLLLNEAAVRFDFSQYTDINDMVDVNGGWGPIDPDADSELVAKGLRISATNSTWQINGAPGGPLVMSGDGTTIMSIVSMPERDLSGLSRRITQSQCAADVNIDFAPELQCAWRQAVDRGDSYTFGLTDVAPGYNTVVDSGGDQGIDPVSDPDAVSLLVQAVVVDVSAGELRLYMVGPVGAFAQDFGFDITPEYASGLYPVDGVYCISDIVDLVHKEWLAWNRALTPAEVNTLITHFTPDPDPAQLLLNEAAVRFDFSQYTDINDMVDVNGGWGPLVPGPSFDVEIVEFTEEGLLLDGGGDINADLGLEGSPSPLIVGPIGMTYVEVGIQPPGWSTPIWEAPISNFTFWCDNDNNATPGGRGGLSLFNNLAGINGEIFDTGASPDDVAVIEDVADPFLASGVPGLCVHVVVVDVAAQTLRTRSVSPETDDVRSVAFIKPIPDFATDPQQVDSLRLGGFAASPGIVKVEWLAWNRALTPAEVDTLIAHFTA